MLSRPAFCAIALTWLLLVPLLLPSLHGSPRTQLPPSSPQTRDSFYCPMHPEIKSSQQGRCPKCGMTLRAGPPTPQTDSPDPGHANATREELSLVIPDVTVFDQNGSKLHFYSDLVKDRIVAINFIFTTCTTICPPLTANMSKVQQELKDNPGRPGLNVQLISVTVDPATDVPERLNSFATRFGAKPGWTFVTGDTHDIDRLLRALGAYVSNRAEHSPMILIGNERARYWTRSYGLARPSSLRDLIVQAAAKPSPDNPR